MILPTTRSRFISLGDPLIWAEFALGVGSQSLSVEPLSINSTAITTVTFTGNGTTWNSTPPTFTPSGVSGVSTSSLNVIDDVTATLVVETTNGLGTITWSDSSSTGTCTQTVVFCGKQTPVVVKLPLVYWMEDWI